MKWEREPASTVDCCNIMVVRVEIFSDVFMVCLFHALSTEKEEVMGLLIGEVRNAGSIVNCFRY